MKILSLDAETDGLYGRCFAIAFTIREDGKEVHSWQGCCPDNVVSDQWVKENVLPALAEMTVTHNTPDELEDAFWSQWMAHKDGCTVIAHCGNPVESGLFRRCIERDITGRQWDGPYPAIHDVATALMLKGHEPDSVDGYMDKRRLKPQFNGATHHPMYDAVIAAQVWESLQ